MLSYLFAALLTLPALQTPPQPAPQPAPAPAPAPAPGKAPQSKVPWFSGGLDKALAEAKSANKIVFADFGASWCTWCMRMNREVFSTDEVKDALEGVICVSIDYDKQREVAERYLVGKDLPVVIWFNSDGTVRERIEFFQDKPTFLSNTSRIKNDIGTINDLRRKVDASPADLEQRYELHRRLKAVGDAAGAAAQRAAIEKADPQGESRPMRHFKYDALMAAIHAHWAETKSLDPKQIDGLRNFLEVETDPEIMWDGWMSLSNTYNYYASQAQQRGDEPEARRNRSIQRECLARAWRGIPQDDNTLRAHVTGYGVTFFWDVRAELSAEDKALLLTMTEMLARRESFVNDPAVQDLYARALFLVGKKDAAEAACEHAIEVAKALGQDPKDYEKTLELIRAGR